jgi:hypothetical protein
LMYLFFFIEPCLVVVHQTQHSKCICHLLLPMRPSSFERHSFQHTSPMAAKIIKQG